METLQLKAAMAVGGLLIDRKATKLVIKASNSIRTSLSSLARDTSLRILDIVYNPLSYFASAILGTTFHLDLWGTHIGSQ